VPVNAVRAAARNSAPDTGCFVADVAEVMARQDSGVTAILPVGAECKEQEGPPLAGAGACCMPWLRFRPIRSQADFQNLPIVGSRLLVSESPNSSSGCWS